MSIRANFRRAVGPCCVLLMALSGASCNENNPPSKSASDSAPADSSLAQAPAVVHDSVMHTSTSGVVAGTGVPNGDEVVSGPLAAATDVNNPAPAQPRRQVSPVNTPAQAKPAAAKEVHEDAPAVPKGARWTIACLEVGGPGHGERAKRIKEDLASTTKMNQWYVVHEEDKSVIYYGFFRTIDRNTADGKAAQAELARLRDAQTPSGEQPMKLAAFKPIERPAPQAPDEWDLSKQKKAKSDDAHYWSLQIAAYTAEATDDEGHDRKWAAVESVKALREKGIPAYFYHGDSISSVCIGVWPANAVKRQNGADAQGNASAANAQQPFFVSNTELPRGMVPLDEHHNPVRTLAPKVEILDPKLYETIQQYPSHQINSELTLRKVKNPKTGAVEMVPEPSMLVLVPEPKEESLDAIQQQLLQNQNALPTLTPPPSALGTDQPLPPQKGVGKLKSAGD